MSAGATRRRMLSRSEPEDDMVTDQAAASNPGSRWRSALIEYFQGVCGYFSQIVERPTNLLLARVGARRWVTRKMISWGLASAAMAVVTDWTGCLVIRFLPGSFEG